MKQKENIFEELNRMRSLIHTRAGVVISEQANNINADIEAIKKEMTKGALVNSDEQKVVDVLKKYAKDKATLKSFLDQYKTTTGTALTDIITKQFSSNTDQGEIRDLNSVLSKIGVTFEVGINADRTKFVASFKGLDTPAAAPAAAPAAGTRTPEAMKNITSTFCGVRGGKITVGAFKDQPWTNYKATYKVTDAEEQEAKKSCPTVQVSAPSGQSSRQNVNNRFSKSAESLGIQGGKMDLQTLQSILKTLEGGQSTAAATETPAASTGTPDLAQLTAALNQL